MARLARFIVPGIPHHVTQRGNNRRQTFFSNADYSFYVELLRGVCRVAGVRVWNWVLMPNHVHLILVPQDEDGIRACMARVSRAYAGRVHAREKTTGHFWQGRYGCVAMDEAHLMSAMRYVSMNPVRARLSSQATGWRWSGVHALIDPAHDDRLIDHEALGTRTHGFAEQLASMEEAEDERFAALRRSESIGRPVGCERFMASVARATGRDAAPARRGPKQTSRAMIAQGGFIFAP